MDTTLAQLVTHIVQLTVDIERLEKEVASLKAELERSKQNEGE